MPTFLPGAFVAFEQPPELLSALRSNTSRRAPTRLHFYVGRSHSSAQLRDLRPGTRTIRGIRSGVEVGEPEGHPQVSVVNCDTILTIPQDVIDPPASGQAGQGGPARGLT